MEGNIGTTYSLSIVFNGLHTKRWHIPVFPLLFFSHETKSVKSMFRTAALHQ